MVSQAVQQVLSLPTGYRHNPGSDMFGGYHTIWVGDKCIGSFGKSGDRYWINSKVRSYHGTLINAQAAADKLVQLWERDCPALNRQAA